MSFIKKLFGSSNSHASELREKDDSPISRRGNEATATPLRPDLEVFFETKANMWHPETNPSGQFPLNMAENNLNWSMMQKKLVEVTKNVPMPKWVSGYTGMRGDSSFLEAMAQFMTDHLTHVKINPDHLASLAGATAIIELTAWILCDAGDVAVIPAPCYPVYTQDIFSKANVERFDLITHHHIEEITDGHPLNIHHLEKTHQELSAKGKRFKMLLITTPDNPTGHIYSEERLIEIAQWCKDRKIHLVVNELYGLSLIDTKHPKISNNYSQHIEFQSFARVMQNQKSDYLHLIYGLSKDFGMSGLRVGFLYSLNESLMKAFANISAPHLVSNYTQWVISEVFRDKRFIKKYIAKNQKKLTESCVIVSESLQKMNIPFVPPRGSLFVWLDMSEFLDANTSEAESELWLSLFNESGVLLTPGVGFGHTKHGQFRLVHPFVNKKTLKEAMKRMEEFVIKKRSGANIK